MFSQDPCHGFFHGQGCVSQRRVELARLYCSCLFSPRNMVSLAERPEDLQIVQTIALAQQRQVNEDPRRHPLQVNDVSERNHGPRNLSLHNFRHSWNFLMARSHTFSL